MKGLFASAFAVYQHYKNQKWINNPIEAQNRVFKNLINKGLNTQFGVDHNFDAITSYTDFQNKVPIRDYEGLKAYVDEVVQGKKNILWPGLPIYFAKTSGTTSGVKYIPITKVSIKNQIKASRDAILNYIYLKGSGKLANGKMIFLQGSPVLSEINGIKLGRLSGISAHYVPRYLQKNRLPSWPTNCIEDWETKVDAIVEETINEDLSVIAGIPSWVQMYFEKLKTKTNKPIGTIFKNFELFIYGGVNYEPYKSKFDDLIGRPVHKLELFPASEGFFAYQDGLENQGLLLLVNHGIFYEFVPSDEFHLTNTKRLTLAEVELGVNYVLIISTNAGLWAYNIGDTVRFVSLNPYKIVVTGRIKHFISAFGEHVIAKEVEEAMKAATAATDALVNEFTVAPMISPPDHQLPYHEWFVEFDRYPTDMNYFVSVLDRTLQNQNSYYLDLIEGNVLQPLKINPQKKGSFAELMKSMGKLGGQNKVQRLANDRKIAEELIRIKETMGE